jgi:hypothetical protein
MAGLTTCRSCIEAESITYDIVLAVRWRYKDGVSSDFRKPLECYMFSLSRSCYSRHICLRKTTF